MKIAIVGAGFTGLTAAFRLSQKGHQVVIFEKEGKVGGLAGGFKQKGWSWFLDNFYHHFFPSDNAARKLISDVGFSQKLIVTRPKTSIYYQNKISQFDSPFTLLSFPYLSFAEKIRAGLVTAYLKLITNWRALETSRASDWLVKFYGRNAYQILWQPLLQLKFGDDYQKISMAWLWARIKKRTARLMFLEGGLQSLANELAHHIKQKKGKIFLNHPINHFNDIYHECKFDRVIVTTPMQTFLQMAPQLPQNYLKKYQNFKMLGALNLILILKEKFLTDGTYWLNINESGFPFITAVEQTNFVAPSHYGGHHILYIGGYYPQNHRYFQMNKEQIFEEFLPHLQKINPNYQLPITNYYLFKNLFAQPIMPLNYSLIIPPHKTPLPGVFLANMQQVYPWDRETNYAIEMGEKIADEVENS